MRLLHDAPIKRKLYAIIMGTVAVVLVLSLISSLVVQIGAARDAAEARLQAVATLLGANSRAIVSFRDHAAAVELLATLATQEDVLSAEILLPDGEVFASYGSGGFDAVQQSGPVAGPGWSLFDPMIVQRPILFDVETIGQFRVVGDMNWLRDILVWQALLVVGVFAVSMLLAMLLSRQLQRIVSVPVHRLLDAMSQVATNRDFGRRAERVGDDELGQLTDGFNDMLDQIQAYDRELGKYRLGLEQQVIERTEELESARQQALGASRAKSDFLATMSHEIRTPMTGVIGFSRLLDKTALDSQQRDYTRIISKSALNLLDIIDDILDFSKIEAGKIELDRQNFEVEELLEGVRTAVAAKAREKGLELAISCAADVPPVLYGDLQRVRQILINLAGNAVKFTDKGAVALSLENGGLKAGGVLLRISIQDTGIGISPEQQASLFKPFQQADGSITRRFGGTGLGLVITQRLVHLMDGEITLSSAPGEGSIFNVVVRLELPREAGSPVSSSVVPESDHAPLHELIGTEEPAQALAGLRILIVDDSPINLKLAAALLESRDVEVVAVESAAAALELISYRSFELILMDLEMPGMSGIEAARRIRAAGGEKANLPIIAITAHAFVEKREEVVEAGMNDLLAKPYLPEQLYAMVAKWVTAGRLDAGGNEKGSGLKKELPVYDREVALAIVDGDEHAAQSMLEEFLKGLPDSDAALRAAHLDADYDALYYVVHRLAGATPVVGATALHASASELQNYMRLDPRPLERIDMGVARLLREIARFRVSVTV